MENQKHHLDEIFHQRLHNAEVPPPPFVWPAVEQALQPKRRRRPIAFWWLTAAGTVLLGAVALWALNQQEAAQLSAFTPPVAISSTTEQTLDNPAASLELPTAVHVQSESYQTKGATRPTTPRQHNPLNAGERPVTYSNPSSPSAEPVAEATPVSTPATLNIANLPLLSGENSISAAQEADMPTLKPFKSGARRKKVQPRVCYDFNRHPSALLIDVYAGPSIAQRSLTSRQDDEPYLKQRLATESRDLAFNAGLRASLMFNRNFLLRTGLHYDQFTEVFEYIDPTSVTYTLKFTPGNPIPDTIGVQYGENYLKTYNRYGALDIPLMVGVEMRSGRSGFNINAGISANVLFWKRGAIIDPQTHEPARFGGKKETLSEEVFRTRLSLSAGATVQWYWHVTPHTRLFVEPSFRQVLRPVTLQSHSVDQRYSILGLRLGYTMIF